MRIDDLSHVVLQHCTRTHPSGSVWTPINRVSVRPGMHRVVRSDITINPKSSDGWRKPSSYSALVTESFVANVNAEIRKGVNPVYTWNVQGHQNSNISSPLYEITSAMLSGAFPSTSVETECNVKAFLQIANRKGSILETVAELKSTVTGLARNATMVNKFVTSAVRKDWKGAARAIGLAPRSRKARRARDKTVAAGGGVSDAWLNYSFGLVPIMSDMVFAMVILGHDREIRVNGTGVVSTPGVLTKHSTSGFHGYGTFPWNGSYYRSTKSGARTSLWYSVRTAELARFNELGLYDVPATIWAVVPKSFAVDWVIPVSSILKAWTADVGLTFRGGTFTRFARIKITDAKYGYVDAVRTTVVTGKSWDTTNLSGFQMERKVYTEAPKPTKLFVKDPLSLWTAVTALALLGVNLQSIFNKRQ